MKHALFVATLVLSFAAACGVTMAQTSADASVSEAIKPQCAGAWKLDAGKCVADDRDLATLQGPDCQAALLKWDDVAKTCTRGAAPAPSCGNAVADLVSENGQCVIKRAVARSAPGDYVGDCFKIVARPDGTSLVPDGKYLVVSQGAAGQDRELRLVAAKSKDFIPFGCVPDGDGVHTLVPVSASKLTEAGAIRSGWAYGMLALPYKYHLDDKSFSTSISIGPYLGRRIEMLGGGFTIAATAALSSVTGAVKDANGVTTNPTLAAFTFAAGAMYDVAKGSAKAFKTGIFIGRDIVGSDSAASYVHNRKNWFALQLGYDFTDN